MDKVVHFEIPADDIERAKKFYSECFKWDVKAYPEMDYTILRTGPADDKGMPTESGFISGGMMKRNNNVKSPVITVSVENIDKAIETVKKNGGSIVGEKFDVAGMGIGAYFKDTEGNVIGLWQNTAM